MLVCVRVTLFAGSSPLFVCLARLLQVKHFPVLFFHFARADAVAGAHRASAARAKWEMLHLADSHLSFSLSIHAAFPLL